MSTEDWQKCIDFFTSPTFVVNRGKAKYPSVQGSKSFTARRYDEDTSPSLDSTAASKIPQGTAHQFSGDSQNNDYRFAMYEAQLRRMQRKIELLKNSILVVVPEEDNNEDAILDF
ncbi:hypothetical protein Adt_34949 [Abeliophyllum distichum]|uniref:Uncharacterized protein n=1 Tax=Abeliophyllum distichum TaxID=126358 RepID=A0ABD1R0K6_9LAMI